MSGRSGFGQALLVCLAALLALTGCTQPKVTATFENTNNLGSIQYAYLEATRALKRPPQNLDELKPHLTKLGDPEKLLVSPRDGKPYIIVWGLDLVNPQGSDNPVYAYEQVGRDGERIVGSTLEIKAMTEAEFSQLKLPK